MKQTIITLLLALLPLVASADAVEIGGIYYNLIAKGKVAEVTSNPNKYTGTVEIPETVTYNDVIYDVTSIGQYAFSYSKSLTDVIIPQSVKSIMSYAFSGCTLSTITIPIPNSVATIGDWCFSSSAFTNITIPNSVTSIGYGVFSG